MPRLMNDRPANDNHTPNDNHSPNDNHTANDNRTVTGRRTARRRRALAVAAVLAAASTSLTALPQPAHAAPPPPPRNAVTGPPRMGSFARRRGMWRRAVAPCSSAIRKPMIPRRGSFTEDFPSTAPASTTPAGERA